MTHEERVARRFSAAMAVRPRLFIDPAFVAIAATTKDAELLKLVREATDAPLRHGRFGRELIPTGIEDDVRLWHVSTKGQAVHGPFASTTDNEPAPPLTRRSPSLRQRCGKLNLTKRSPFLPSLAGAGRWRLVRAGYNPTPDDNGRSSENDRLI